jgi:hypothetical protein
VACGHDLRTSIAASGPAHDAWREVTATLVDLASDPDSAFLSNLLPSLFMAHDIAKAGDTARVVESWRAARALIGSTPPPQVIVGESISRRRKPAKATP